MDKNINKNITHKHLERLLTSQEYFVWHSNIDNILESVEEEEEESLSEAAFWDISSDYDLEELSEYKFVEIIKNGFECVNESFINQISEEAQKYQKKVIVINEKSNQLSFLKTIEALENKDIDWIINPVFLFENLLVKCSLFKKESNSLFSLVHASKTKLKNYIKAYFDFNVLNKLGIKIDNYLFYTYDKDKDYLEPKKLSFNCSKYCWTQKNGPSNNSKKMIEEVVKETIIDKLHSGIIISKTIKNQKTKTKIEVPILMLDSNKFDDYIQQIEDAYYINQIPNHVNDKDLTQWGNNPHFLELFDFSKYELKKVCGYLLNKHDLLDIEKGIHDVSFYLSKKLSLKNVLLNKSYFDKEAILECVTQIKQKKCVWYDFEGFSMPYPILAHSKPYQQIVFQLSLIRTNNEKIIDSENIVIDPLKISSNDFISIINKIYWFEADAYVVYNKSYELSRLKEMLQIIEMDNLVSFEQKNELKMKIETIKDKTLDLFDMFKVTSSPTNLPPIFIPDLLGFSSIKKLEKYISEKKFCFDVMIKPYSELDVKNGLMAMNKGIQRYLNSIGDQEWNIISKQLAEYCENDVKAMIMVYYFIKYLSEKY